MLLYPYPSKPGIYLFRNKLNGMVYVGKSLNIRNRIPSHKYSMLSNDKHYFVNSLRKYGWDSFTIEILAVYDKIENDVLIQIERYYIKKYDATNREKGYNIEKFSNDRSFFRGENNPMYGKRHSQEVMDRILKTKKERGSMPKGKNHHYFGTHLSEERKKKIGDARRGIPPANVRRIKQIDKSTGKLIKIWESIDAAARGLGRPKSSSAIGANCAKRPSKDGYFVHSCLGFVWKYEEDNSPFEEVYKFKVKQIDPITNAVIKVWDSPTIATIALIGRKNKRAMISSVCGGKRKLAFGFKWEYV